MEFYPVHFLWHIATATLFLMSLYTIIIGIRTKLKTFYWYFIYSFFLLIYIQLQSFYFEISSEVQVSKTLYVVFHWFVQVIYNCAYSFFFIYLLDVKTHLPKFARFLKNSIIGLFSFSVLMAIISIFLNDDQLFVQFFHYGFTPIISILGVAVLIKLWQIPGSLKVFFFIGGLSYMSFALVALILSKINTYNADDLNTFVPMVFFYIGVIIEQICFGFALGYFTDQINQKYRKTITQNLNLKSKHNKELKEKLNKQSNRLKQLSLEAEEKKVALVKSEYESKLNESRLSSLQSKMNPHFIFNALNSIKAFLIENDKRKAVNYMNRFSKLVRKILESSRVDHTTLEEELEILKLYVDIENTRFNNEIDFAIQNSASQKALKIDLPPLILQPFIENAIWHGLATSEKSKKLCVKISETQNYVKVEIDDNGIGRQQSFASKKENRLKKKSMGMRMTQERLNVYNDRFDKNYSFEITDKIHPETGTLVSVYFTLDKLNS
ncbi:MAG: hypothetical protein GVY05_00315 [Bacteroidetes bacterium]|jgi:sensor histidine kinase YesM|nr:hypothetical protein [Bacteroidota bacterium]